MLTVPNLQSSPTFDGQAATDFTDWTTLQDAPAGIGVQSGGVVAFSSGRAYTVTAVTFTLAGYATHTTSSATVTVAAASSTDRRDMIVADSSTGLVSIVAGTPGAVANWTRGSGVLPPVKPLLTATQVLIAEVWVPGGSSTLSIANIIDKRLSVLVPTAAVVGADPAGAAAAAAAASIPLTQKAANSGVATLDTVGDVPVTQLGNVLPSLGSLQILGHSWAAGGGIAGPESTNKDWPATLMGLTGASDPDVLDLTHFGSALTNPEGPNQGGWGAVMQFIVPDNTIGLNQSGSGDVDNPTIPQPPTVCMWGVNDPIGSISTWPTHGLTAWAHAVVAAVSRTLAVSLYQSNDATVTQSAGVWTLEHQYTGNSFGGYIRATANAAAITITLPVDFPGGVVAVQFIGTADTDTGTYGVNWTGTASGVSGTPTTRVAGQGYNGNPVAVVTRFTCVPADAGKTIIATVAGISGGTPQVNFDSWWLEGSQGITLFANVPRWPYGSVWSPNTPATITPAQNAATVTALANFPTSTVKLLDIDAIWFARSALVNTAITTTSATTIHVTTQGPNFPITARERIALTDGTNMEDMLVTAILITSTGLAPVAPIPTGTALTLTVTRAYNGTTAHTFAVNSWVGDGTLMSGDDVHPNEYGQAVIADAVYQQLQTMIASGNDNLASQLNRKGSHLVKWPALRIPNSYYKYADVTNTSTGNLGNNNLFVLPVYIPHRCIVIAMGCEVTTAGTSSAMRVGLYGCDSSGGRPGNLIADFGQFPTTTVSSTLGVTSIWQMLEPGWYWMAAVNQGGTAPSTVFPITLSVHPPSPVQQAFAATAFGQSGYLLTGISGGLPGLWGATFSPTPVAPFTVAGFHTWLQLASHEFG